MSTLKLKVVKSGQMNPSTKEMGYAARVITNGTAGFDDIVAAACRNTTVHKAEAKVALELSMESVAEMLKQGYIVDLGPVGKLYPSCTSGWVEKAEDLQLSSVTPSLYYRATEELSSAVKGASLQWAKAGETADTSPEGGNASDDATGGDGDTRGEEGGGLEM